MLSKYWKQLNQWLIMSIFVSTLLLMATQILVSVGTGNTVFGSCKYNEPGNNIKTWWRHQMETFSVLLALCAGNSPVTGEFPSQRPVMQSFDNFFDLHQNKRLSTESRRWWLETPSYSLWRHCNGNGHVVWLIIMFDQHQLFHSRNF